jgi:hypothetical protein
MIRKLILLVILVLIGVGYYVWHNNKKQVINSFDDCVKAGGAILESYPEQCRPPNLNKTFTNPAQKMQN